ncbi:hypothetical protein [Kouleothrix sp.]|uniref:hypothetical protein n=1 Tax=Kouleothrix sp. TaxID=2779161 RepID=UPI003918C99B
MTTLALRPQPLGVFALPAGYLVLPPAAGSADIAAELLAGRAPASFPPELRFYALALQGDAQAALAALEGDTTPEAAYNRLVLGGDPADYARLRGELRGELAQLLDLAAYTLGWAEAPPARGAADGELAACVLAAHATLAIERGDDASAIELLDAAIDAARPVSPLLAAQLLGDIADLQAQDGAGAAAVLRLREALDLLAGDAMPDLRAQLALRLGMLYQDLARGQRGPLLEAAKCYQEALKTYTRDAAPELYALAQNNLALAYLAMPLTESSDQLRMAIGVQGLREALKIFTRETHPDRWASAQLNLANALQYLPSAHPEDHLAEAVELYEELLGARDPARDPLGYARLLANQGNALAHLGIFRHAREKLDAARALFERHGDPASAEAVAEVLATIDASEHATQDEHGSIPAPAV